MKLINPSIYWKYLGGELFLLKQLAQIVFSVLSSSSICETKFRDYEYIMDKRRLRLRPELAEKLVFVYCNKMMKSLTAITSSRSVIVPVASDPVHKFSS